MQTTISDFRDDFTHTLAAAVTSIEEAQAGLRDNLPAGMLSDYKAGSIADLLRDAHRSLTTAIEKV
nr:hypothetical protein [Rhodococcus sp. (in: high G+C Gram-positive bacteria)]